MTLNSKEKAILISKILAPLIFVILLFLYSVTAGIVTLKKTEIYVEEIITATVKIDFGENMSYSKEITLINGTVYNFTLELEKFGDIKIKATYFEQYDSYFIDSISYGEVEYKTDTNHYWIYYINGEPGMEGANKVHVENGNIIEWKYEKF